MGTGTWEDQEGFNLRKEGKRMAGIRKGEAKKGRIVNLRSRPGRNFSIITFNYDYLAIMKMSIVRFINVIS